jgi:hypothetical protein
MNWREQRAGLAGKDRSMAAACDLHTALHSRFRSEFGEPNNTLGSAEQWSLLPSPGAMNITLFVNGPIESSSVWVLDPYDLQTEVEPISVTEIEQIQPLIDGIRGRVERAARRYELDDDPPRHRMFIQALRSWCNSVATGRKLSADVDIVKLKMAGKFMADHPQFAAAFNRTSGACQGRSANEGLECMGAFLTALAAVSQPL